MEAGGGSRGRGRGRGGGGGRGGPSYVLMLATILACCIGSAAGFCVVDNKKGWHLKCGVRDSYLFRLKDYGGLNANFDFNFGLGDEAGFPFSIKNTKGGHHYYRRKDSTARSSAGEEEGGGGSWLRPPPNLRPPPSGHSSQERSSSISHPSSDEGGVPRGPPTARRDTGFDPSTERNAPIGYASTERGAVIGSSSNERSSPIGPPHTRSPGSGASALGGRSWSSWWPSRRRSGPGARRPSSSSSSSIFSRLFSWLPWPFGEGSWFGGSSRADSRNSHFRVIQEPSNNHLPFNGPQLVSSQTFKSTPNIFGPNSFSSNNLNSPNKFNPAGFNSFGFNSFEFDPLNPFAGPLTPFPQPPPPQPPSQSSSSGPQHPTVGAAIGDVLKVAPNTPADTDHVPSFAAKMFVVREAPEEYYPPGYKPTVPPQRSPATVEVPRTKFFCEEQRYLPGLYADTQLGCKVFHMCLPAAVGNTQTSFLCPNMTLFDQSILQCNWWYYVRCEDSPKNYDANLPLALSYRRVNAAQLPLTAVGDYNSIALLDVTARTARNLQWKEGDAVGRMGLAAQREEEEVEERQHVTPFSAEEMDEGEYTTPIPDEDLDEGEYTTPIPDYDVDEGDYTTPISSYERDEGDYTTPIPDYDVDEGDYTTPMPWEEKQEQEAREQGVKAPEGSDNGANEMREDEKGDKEGEKEEDGDANEQKEQEEVVKVPSYILGTEHGNTMNVRIFKVNKLQEQDDEEKVEDIKVDRSISPRIRRRRSSDSILSNAGHFSSPLLSQLLRRRNPMP